MKIILASTSPRRRKILKSLGIRHQILKPLYHEKRMKLSPAKLVCVHAEGKAHSVIRKNLNGIVLGLDTLVYLDGKVIGKPKNLKDSFRILNYLQGRWHTVYTGVVILTVQQGRVFKKKIFCEKTKVLLKPLSHQNIKNYFKRINPLDKAGAYAIQSGSASIVQEIKGSFSNVMGLPVEALKRKLADLEL